MKLTFSKSVGWSWAKSLPFLAGLLLSPLVVMATDSIYISTGNNIYSGPGAPGNTIPSPPQVDATNFVNSGTWDIETPTPYQTAHTLNYTNTGLMWGAVGWEFDYGPLPPPGGGRGMSASFFNDNSGIVRASTLSLPNPFGLPYGYPVSYLWISATNIVNKGVLIGSDEIHLTGSYVDLTRSTLEIDPFVRGGSYQNATNFSSATAIYDEYWQQTNTFPYGTPPNTLDSSAIWDGTNATSPIFYVNLNQFSPLGGCVTVLNTNVQIGFVSKLADSTNIASLLYVTNVIWTNFDGSGPFTNSYISHIFRQAVFVGVGDTNHITATNRFLDTGNPTNLFKTAIVKLTSTSASDTLYLEDALASADSAYPTNRGVLLNTNNVPGSDPLNPCTSHTYRPANYNLEGMDDRFTLAIHGAGTPANSFLYDPVVLGFTNANLQAVYAGYSAYVDDLARRPYGSAVTNWPGRIMINADSLDLTKATINDQFGSEVTIQTKHLISDTGAVVSCRNLSFNIGSTNGNLNVTNFAGTNVSTLFHGTINAFSALWTNGYPKVIPNYTYDTTASNWVEADITNFVEVDLHVLLVDATGLSTTEPVTVQDLVLNSTNMVIGDSMNVANKLLFNGQSLVLLTNLNLSGNAQNWTYADAPNLRYFTNNGTLSIPQDAHFGDDGPTNYASFVNNGTITVGGSETIDSDYFQDSGALFAPGGVFVITSNGLVTNNANIFSGEDVDFTGGALKLTHATIFAGNHLYFNLTNKLYDASPSAGNLLLCENGFSLLSKPEFGDLLGTTIISERADGAEVDHVWAGVDLGAAQIGSPNNVTIGTLELTDDGVPTSANDAPLFSFSGASTTAGVTNALYVNNLDLSGLSYPNDEVEISDNLIIYYINLSGSIPVPFASHFIHVAGPAGGYTGSIRSPKFAAGYVVGSGLLQFTVTNAVADQTYTVEASTNLPAGNWAPIFITNAPLSGLFQFIVPDTSSYPTRFYRIVTSP